MLDKLQLWPARADCNYCDSFSSQMEKAYACFYRRRNDMLYAACAVGVHMIEMN